MQIVSFSGRGSGNCAFIADFITKNFPAKTVERVNAGDLRVHECSGCNYECIQGECVHREDEAFPYFESTKNFDCIVWLIPMYCGNPSSLYFKITERGQDYWMRNEACHEPFLQKLYLIGIGNETGKPVFNDILSAGFLQSGIRDHVLVLESKQYRMKSLYQDLTGNFEIQKRIERFLQNINH